MDDVHKVQQMNRPGNALEPRTTYRHGDLRRTLVEAGLALAREGGPNAIALREVTRRAGVVPNAAYRHFANHAELLQAVRAEALAAVARSMEDELDAVPVRPSPAGKRPTTAENARARLRAVGRGYLRFAWDEPGLFSVAFLRPADAASGLPTDPASAGRGGLGPFQLLGAALDGLVEAGVLPLSRRKDAEYLAWSTVHGLALLVSDGALRGTPRAQSEALAERALEMVERGL